MDDMGVSNSDVGDGTDRTDVTFCSRVLVLGIEEYRKAALAKTSPDILHQVVFYQHADRILELQVMPYNEGIASISTLKWRVPRHPLPRLEEVIEADGDVGWSGSRGASAKHDGLT